MNRRTFIGNVAAAGVGASVIGAVASRLEGQQPAAAMDSSNLFAMDQSASRPVRLPPKPGARALITSAERDELEHRIRCQCGCTLDVYTCRTTDFSCQVSPSMHRDVMSLVAGGYSAQEIIDAFVGVYGERVLMAPRAEGFNLLGWVAPFVALGTGAVAVMVLLRRWRRPRESVPTLSAPVRPVDATDEELARLSAAVREDE